SAYPDAMASLSTGLNLLQKLSDSPERIKRELPYQLALGRALSVLKGFAAPEVESAYNRAREICERLDDPAELFPTLYGLQLMQLVRSELRRGRELAEHLLLLAQRAHDPELL